MNQTKPFIGREKEIALFKQCFEAILPENQGKPAYADLPKILSFYGARGKPLPYQIFRIWFARCVALVQKRNAFIDTSLACPRCSEVGKGDLILDFGICDFRLPCLPAPVCMQARQI